MSTTQSKFPKDEFNISINSQESPNNTPAKMSGRVVEYANEWLQFYSDEAGSTLFG